MTEHVQAPDGTRIAFDRVGAGQPLVLIGGAGQFRAVDPDTRELTAELARRGFDVVHYDRPGRGDSDGEPPFGLAREVAAVGALVEAMGGRAWLQGSSSGGAVRACVATGDPEAVWRLYTDGMPPEWFASMRSGPRWPLYERMAPTLAADAEALAWTQSAPRAELWAAVDVPVLVLLGADTFPFMAEAADALVRTLPRAERAQIRGSGHRWEPADLADRLAAELPTALSGPSGAPRWS